MTAVSAAEQAGLSGSRGRAGRGRRGALGERTFPQKCREMETFPSIERCKQGKGWLRFLKGEKIREYFLLKRAAKLEKNGDIATRNEKIRIT